MKTRLAVSEKPFLFSAGVVWLALASSILCLAQSKQSASSSTTRSQIRMTVVKPDMVNEWVALQKNQVNPALKKAGVSTRTVLTNAYGNAYEYLSVTPLQNYSELDGEGPLIHALGKDGGAHLQASLSKCIESQHVYISTLVNELSSPPDPKAPAPVWVTIRFRTAPGKTAEYENYFKTDLAPVYAKAKATGKIAGYGFTRRGFGADPLDRTLVIYGNKFADLEAGNPLTQVLGQEAAAKLQAKGVGMATVVEQLVRRRVADLSF